ncbi:uncharacterized protein LOC113232610 [Hyposmocoma kahamanoa]|uniref:uncharacterized protein LOC113232610 n=1 Tax=Hyposmocoma kahamanoa TaxID=1477025 RepID=UPI000E6D5D49|nr:uncharacterized protein LOC113232610 [Hyposmocoma kahamanoa]
MVGCHIDGVCINNISYADDMVLLSPSMGGLRKLLRTCEAYAVPHGLKYNAKKSEFMVFKAAGMNYTQLLEVSLCGTVLSRVSKFKYLRHWVTENLNDNCDIERERRSLAVRCEGLEHRPSRCFNAGWGLHTLSEECEPSSTCRFHHAENYHEGEPSPKSS